MDSMVHEDDEGLWDELSHLQSREIAQHHARHHSSLSALAPVSESSTPTAMQHGMGLGMGPTGYQNLNTTNNNNHRGYPAPPSQNSRAGTTHSSTPLRRLLRHMTEDWNRCTAVFYNAAADAWEEQKQRQEQRRASSYRYQLAPVATTDDRATAYLNDFGIPTGDDVGGTPIADAGVSRMAEYTSLDEYQQQQQQQTGHQNNDDFIFLPNFRLRPQAEGWGAVANLDLYLNSLYSYFYHRGLTRIVAKGVVELVTLVFTMVLSVFLFLYVDWKALTSCIDETTCHADFAGYVVKRPFHRWTMWNLMVVMYCFLFTAYTVMAVLSFLRTVQDALQAKWVFEERLGITARRLQGGAVDWDRDVVHKLLELQRTGEYRIAIHNGPELDALVVAQRIMRKENFLVALFNRGLLDLSAPIPVFGNNLFCSTLEWSLYFCILNFMFNHKYQIRPAFYLDPAALRRRFLLCGITHLVFMPFLLFSQMSYFGLQNAYDWKNTAQYLGPKDWSPAAKWKIREFNELQHNFERRLEPSYEAADDYLKLFGPNEVIAAIGRVLVFVGGSLGAVLFAFAAMNDAILLHVKIADWNLLWYAGVVGALYSCGKSMMPTIHSQSRASRNMFEEIDQALAKVSSHTHYYPQSWRGRGWDESTQKAFSSMYQFKAKLFGIEVLSLLVAPYVLCVSLVSCAEPICEFVLAIRAEVAGAGDICGYSTFDFEKYGDETWEDGPHENEEPLAGTLTESILRSRHVDQAAKNFPPPRTKDRKMQHSFESFQLSHPIWNSNSSKNHRDEAGLQQQEETSALSMEQKLHIEAANRQLETLVELERNGGPPGNGLHHVDESHIV